MTAVTVLEIVLTAACLSCLAGVWHYYDVAKQARIDRANWHDRFKTTSLSADFWIACHDKMKLERDEWKRKHEALVLVVKMRADGRLRG